MKENDNFYQRKSYKKLNNQLDYEQKEQLALLVCEAIRFGINRMYEQVQNIKEVSK